MEKLKACPFCGGEAVVYERAIKGQGGCDLGMWQAGCGNCGAQVPSCEDKAVRDREGIRLTKDGLADATAAWNRRHKPRQAGGEE